MSLHFQDLLKGAMARVDEERKASASNMLLGAFIDRLGTFDPSLPVEIDTGGSVGRFDSYRGYYEDLSAVPTQDTHTVEEVLSMARDACGAVMTGYKGGKFPMHRASIMWVADYGSCGRKLIGLRTEANRVVIETTADGD